MNARRRSSKTKNWPKNLYCKPDGYFWYRNPENGKVKGLGRDRAAAFEAADAANAVLAAKKHSDLAESVKRGGSKRFDEWVGEYLEILLKERTPARNTIARVKLTLRFICKEAFAKKPVNEVTTLDVAAFLKSVEVTRGTGASLMSRSTLSDVFREAEVRGLIEVGKNPVTVTRPARYEVKRDRLSLEQFLAICEHANGWVLNAMRLALLTGQRREDIAAARFSDVKDGYLYVEQGKTGTKLRLALSLRLNAVGFSLEDVVRQCRDNVVSKFLIHHRRTAGRSIAGNQVSPNALTKEFAVARDKAGIETQDGRTPPSFHEIRSLSERLYEKEYGSGFTQKLLGHKSPTMTATYHDLRGSDWIEVATN